MIFLYILLWLKLYVYAVFTMRGTKGAMATSGRAKFKSLYNESHKVMVLHSTNTTAAVFTFTDSGAGVSIMVEDIGIG